MTFNLRHKAILFMTLVATGCDLLLGAELKEAVGFMMLGVAFAWVIGSNAASKLYSLLKSVSGSVYSWIRLPLAMLLVGALLGGVLLYSRGNPVAAIAFSCFAGMFVAPLTSIAGKKLWQIIPMVVLGGILFIFADALIIETDLLANNKYGARFGELSVTAFLAFNAGIFWLSKGWALVMQGITAQPALETPPLNKGSWLQYVSVFLGITILTLWLCLLSWSASSDWAYAPEKLSDNKHNNLLTQVGFIILLAWWPYSSWKLILDRQPNSSQRFLKWHKGVTTLAGMFTVGLLSLAITLGIQNGNDRIMTDRIITIGKDLATVAAKIGTIKKRDLATTGDYIQAYSEIEILLPEFESQISKYHETLQELDQRDASRGGINMQRFYKTARPEYRKNLKEQADVVDAILSLTKQEVEKAKEMSVLPTQEQPDFWKRSFRPLLVKEEELRNKALALDAENKSLRN